MFAGAGVTVTAIEFPVPKQGAFVLDGIEIDQLLIVPKSKFALSIAIKFQVPFGLIAPAPIAVKVVMVVVVHVVAVVAIGLKLPVKGAVPAVMNVAEASVNTVFVKFAPDPPVFLVNASICPFGACRERIRSPT